MAKLLQVTVITTSGQTLTDEAVAVRAPGERGSFGMLYNHAPLVSVLQPGTLSWRTPDGRRQAARIGRGLLEVARNQVTILTDAMEAVGAAREVHA